MLRSLYNGETINNRKPIMKNYTNFSFDVGMTSLGVAVNKNGEIIYGGVLLMHPDAGAVKTQAERRRQFRTREAHKAREAALESLWESIGKKPLQRKCFTKAKNAKGRWNFIKTKADNRLEREFPGQGDDTVYTSCLLRIMLLEGKPLADWQIYKALHAGIQRRGYDKNVPWKSKAEARTKEKDQKSSKDENPEKQIDDFNNKLQEMTPDGRYHLPCYYDAWKMGLWDNQSKKIIYIRQQPTPEQKEKVNAEKGTYAARGYNASRELVAGEIKQLLNCAAEQIPQIKEHLSDENLDQLLYGTQQNAMDRRYPSATRIDGLLGQKYPRFENRIVSKCALITRFNVCKSEKPLAIAVGFLLRMVNWRYEQVDEHGRKSEHALSGRQISDKFDACHLAWQKKSQEYNPEEYAKCFRLTPSKVAKMAEGLDGTVKIGHEEIPASRHTGRSRFSQPSLYLMKSLILSEKTPKGFYEELSQLVAIREKENPKSAFGYQIYSDVTYKYLPDDFKFLQKMGDTRDTIYVPDISLAERYINEDGDVESAIQKVINSCNWPELRHRLNAFRIELERLTQAHEKPDAVHLEFIREDFLSEKEKKIHTNRSNEGKKSNKEAIEYLKESGISVTDKNILRYRLCKEQKNQCLYTGEAIDSSVLENYDIDHIFPAEDGGPDAYYNKVLTSATVNRRQKEKRLPCECDFIQWKKFKTLLKPLSLSKNKKKLLLASTREEAESLIEKYTGLAGTAHIARLARDITCLQFGWQPGAAGEQQRVFVFSGGLTSKVAKKYELYKTLGDGSKTYQKDRSDHRHHALDAMVISYLRQWARDKNKTAFFKFPTGIDADYFAKKLNDVYPRRITRMRPAIADQPGRKRIMSAGTKKSDNEEVKYVNTKEFKNISKDTDERGQWYTNRKEKDKGTYQHGYLFYKDTKGKLCSRTIHSFRSPYAIKKEMEKKSSEIIGLFYQGKQIYLPSQNQITATQLERDARLKFGEYKVFKILKRTVIIGNAEQPQDQSASNDPIGNYRIKLGDFEKIRVHTELMREKSFDLDEFSVNKDKKLTGTYRMDSSALGSQSFIIIVETTTGKNESMNFTQLVQYLVKTNWLAALNVKDIVDINKNHRTYINQVTTNELPGQKLPEGKYQIKAFSGNQMELLDQRGTVYRIASKILAHTTPITQPN